MAGLLAGGLRWFAGDDRPGSSARATAAEIDGAHVARESTGTPAGKPSESLASAMVQASTSQVLQEEQAKIAGTASALGSAKSGPARHPSQITAVVSVDPDAIDPDSVVGRPFPLSPSVRTRGCEVVHHCDWLEENLTSFAKERREPQWAAEMEAKLRDFVMAQGDKYKIRTIECRTSVCLVEVASIHGDYDGYIPYSDPLSEQMLYEPVEFGFERDPSSARLTVSVGAYTRR